MSKPNLTAPSPLQAAAENLLSLGYAVVPIMPRQKAPGEYLAGRWKAMDGWTRYKTALPTKFELQLWSRWVDANIGVILGTDAGDGLVVFAIDLDLRSADELKVAMSAMPVTPMSKAGAKGETLFYRGSPEIKSRAFNRPHPSGEIGPNGKVKQDRIADMLTGNATKQTVVPPSRHPDGFDAAGVKVTDEFDYRWLRGPVAARDLPIFDDAAMARFESAMLQLGWVAGGAASAPPGITRHPAPATLSRTTQGRSQGQEGEGAAADVFRELNRAALDNLSTWVPELGLYNCQPARGGFEAVATWRGSSSGRPDAERKRNLSIQSSGIKDFGTEVSYSPIDLVMCANQTSFADAYDWLRVIVGAPEQVGGLVLAFEPKPGKAVNVSPPVDPVEIDNDAMPPTTKAPDLTPAFYDDDATLGEWADKDCFPRGLVGMLARWICETATTPQPLLAYGAALAIIGTVAGRQFAGPTGTGTHLYVIGAAPTGAGKDHPMQCATAALSDSGMGELVGPSDFTSDSAVFRHILERPLSVCLMDEFGSFWKRISNRRAGGWEAAITRALREPWGRSFASMRTKQYAGIGPASAEIWWPAMSILGMTTPGEFFSALSGSDIENGMVNRMLVLTTQRRADDRRTRAEMKAAYFSGTAANIITPEHIRDALKAIRDFQGALIGPQFAFPADQRPTAPTVKATIDDDASELLFSYRQWIEEHSLADDAFGKFYSRGAETAQRVALIHAIGRSATSKVTPHITHDDVVASVRLVDWSLRTLWARVSAHASPEGLREVVQAVFKAIDRRGGKNVSRTDLRASLHGAAKRDLADAIEELEEAGFVRVDVLRESPKQKKPSTVYSIVKRPVWS